MSAKKERKNVLKSHYFSVFLMTHINIYQCYHHTGKTAAEQNRVDIRAYDFMLILWDFATPKKY